LGERGKEGKPQRIKSLEIFSLREAPGQLSVRGLERGCRGTIRGGQAREKSVSKGITRKVLQGRKKKGKGQRTDFIYTKGKKRCKLWRIGQGEKIKRGRVRTLVLLLRRIYKLLSGEWGERGLQIKGS